MLELTPYLYGIVAAYAILMVGSLSPGPSVALLIGIATSQGRTPALCATLGIAFGSMTFNILTMLGVGLLLAQVAWALTVLRILGAAYLLWLAYGAFKRASHPPVLNPIVGNSRSLLNQFLVGYLLQVTNPKAMAFWLAISSVGAVDGASLTVKALFITGAFLVSFICHGAWAVLLSADAIRSAYARWRRWFELSLGCFFVYASYRLYSSVD